MLCIMVALRWLLCCALRCCIVLMAARHDIDGCYAIISVAMLHEVMALIIFAMLHHVVCHAMHVSYAG